MWRETEVVVRGVLSLGEFGVMPHFSMKGGHQEGERRQQKGEKNKPSLPSEKMLLNVSNPQILGCLHKSLIYTISWKNVFFCISASS